MVLTGERGSGKSALVGVSTLAATLSAHNKQALVDLGKTLGMLVLHGKTKQKNIKKVNSNTFEVHCVETVQLVAVVHAVHASRRLIRQKSVHEDK